MSSNMDVFDTYDNVINRIRYKLHSCGMTFEDDIAEYVKNCRIEGGNNHIVDTTEIHNKVVASTLQELLAIPVNGKPLSDIIRESLD